MSSIEFNVKPKRKPKFSDLRDFLKFLEDRNEFKEISYPVDVNLEITEISSRVLHNKGPALLFNNPYCIKNNISNLKTTEPKNYGTPVLANLFGTEQRVAYALGLESVDELRSIGELLAFLKQPDPPKGIKDAFSKLPIFKQLISLAPKKVSKALCHEIIIPKKQVNLSDFPIQTCWPGDVGPLITWGLVTTRNIHNDRQNIGIYRQQVIGHNRVIMRWLGHRGGALDYLEFRKKYPNEPFPVAVTIGADPATILAAVTPIPDSISEYAFAGLLKGSRCELVKCKTIPLDVPASAEIVLEGYIYPNDTAKEGPFGDHTGYYNEVAEFPVFTIETITHREKPIYHSTYTGRPPDEPAVLGAALNEVFVPILQKQFPEISDFYLPPEGCSYRMAVVSIKKQYSGHPQRVMLGIWSFLKQFLYTKFIIITDDDINIRNWEDVIWAITTRVDPKRDTLILENSPIDYLDFASPSYGLGSKLGIDATNKYPGETTREWGKEIKMDKTVEDKIDRIWSELGI
tara:strand:- start:8947 stop:10494 length:1548 start_codon:yes stop_codon:yes gene_type:complete